MSDFLISVVLPIHNQADHVEVVVSEYVALLSNIKNPYEIILVVNGSNDHSLEVCNSLAQRHERLRVLHSKAGGWGLAVKLGLQNAHGDILAFTNSARTTAQDLMLMVLYSLANPKSVIKANRKIRGSWIRRLGSLLYNIECRAFFDLPQWDINGTPKVFPREMDRLLVLTRDDDLVDLEFNIICRQMNYSLLEVPMVSMRRHGGKSTTNYASAIRMYLGAFQMWWLMRTRRS
jgi:glycosyltransferase involved in cell wall biosynthesis